MRACLFRTVVCAGLIAFAPGCARRASPPQARPEVHEAESPIQPETREAESPIVVVTPVGEALRLMLDQLKHGRVIEARPDLPASRAAAKAPEPARLSAHADGKTIDFALAHTSVLAHVTGNVARVEVTQRYHNPSADRLEAVYAFPLPANAAVTEMVFRIGDRVVRSEVRRRSDARATYEHARAEGKAAALTEQERPNLFTQSVANIPPGASVEVLLEYVQEVPFDDGRYQLAVPTTIGPRYIPGEAIGASGPGWSPDTTRVSDASRITPPVVPEGARSANDIDLAVVLQPGAAFSDIASQSHRISLVTADSGTLVGLLPDDRIANRDFVLSYRPSGGEPEARVVIEREGGESYLMLFLQPPVQVAPEWIRPREMVFLIDKSGSMEGKPLDTARALVINALHHLGADDTFQLIAFDGSTERMTTAPLARTADNVARAEAWLGHLTGGGGTEMLSGIRAALAPSTDDTRLRMVVFCTDGYIGNEAEIIDAIERQRGTARVFGFGIGSSVNRYLIEGVARAGRGAAEVILPGAPIDEAVAQLYRRLDAPVLTDLSLSFEGLSVTDLLPERLPDLFAGQPLVAVGRLKGNASGTAILRGRLGKSPREMRIAVNAGPSAPTATEGAADGVLGTLWARRRVEDLTNRSVNSPSPADVEAITKVGLQFKLLTAYTSFVAVEHRISVDPETPLRQMLVPNELPAGVSREGIFGGEVSVTPMRVKPGDPEIHIAAGPTARSARVQLPFGEPAIDAVRDPRSGAFVARFLVPPGFPDGSYQARITISYENGEIEERTAPIRVDTTAAAVAIVRDPGRVHPGQSFELGLKPALPMSRLAAALGGGAPGGRLDALKSAMDVKEILVRAPWGELATARMEGTLGIYVARFSVPEGFQSSTAELEIVASDTAGNISRRALELNVVPAEAGADRARDGLLVLLAGAVLLVTLRLAWRGLHEDRSAPPRLAAETLS